MTTYEGVPELCREAYDAAFAAIRDCFRAGGKLLLCGNGGSAADCAHIAGELVKGFLKKRPLSEALQSAIGADWAGWLQQGLPAIDLTANAAVATATLNDIDGESVFAQQVTAFGKPGDVIIGISTSGNSENVCRALQTARAMGLTTVGMTGADGGRMRALSDFLLNVPAKETYRVQELHLPLYHELCARVERFFFPI